MNGKGVAATQWEKVAGEGYQLVYGATANLFTDRHRNYIGYGPEALYVAFNRFYPPDLAHYEARNASPDRASVAR